MLSRIGCCPKRQFPGTDLLCAHLAMRVDGVRRICHSGEIAGDTLVLELAGGSGFLSSSMEVRQGVKAAGSWWRGNRSSSWGARPKGSCLGDLPGYRYQLIVTNMRTSCAGVWRFCNGEADSKSVIEDLMEG
ncbi:MAG: hypothetical protein ACUVXD_12090, partial [Thermodesulfobacteriota bacterium]